MNARHNVLSSKTAESVTPCHPDKLCDYISDSILDACLDQDSYAKVACDTMITHNRVIVAGDIKTSADISIESIVNKAVAHIGYGDVEYTVEDLTSISPHSSHETLLTTKGQGIVYGYACDESSQYLPLPVSLSHEIARSIYGRTDILEPLGMSPCAKVQVTVSYDGDRPFNVTSVVISFRCKHDADIDAIKKELSGNVIAPHISDLYDYKVYFNHTIEDDAIKFPGTGLTGRKLAVDTYGGIVSHGGGAFSGKDATHIDRSGAYMARYIAKNLVAAGLATECLVSLSYANGNSMLTLEVDTRGTGIYPDYEIAEIARKYWNTSLDSIICTLNLRNIDYRMSTNYSHFTHEELPWEKIDMEFYSENVIGLSY